MYDIIKWQKKGSNKWNLLFENTINWNEIVEYMALGKYFTLIANWLAHVSDTGRSLRWSEWYRGKYKWKWMLRFI